MRSPFYRNDKEKVAEVSTPKFSYGNDSKA